MLEPHLLTKLRSIEQKYHKLTGKLAEQIARDRSELQQIFKDIADIEETVTIFNDWQKARLDLTGATQIVRESIDNSELHQLATLEAIELDRQIAALEHRLRILLLPQDPHDDSNVFLEITADTGGEEALIWAEDLMGMYIRYAQRQNWQAKIVTHYQYSAGGLAAGILEIKGDRVYSKLKFESGIHEVQRYSVLQLKNRINTLTVLNVMPQAAESYLHDIVRDRDLEINHYYSQGYPRRLAMEAHHKPTGIRIACSEENNQRLNQALALDILGSKLYSIELRRQQASLTALHESRTALDANLLPLIVDDLAKIRSYNYLDNRIIDRRLTGDFELNKVRCGDFTDLIQGCLDRDLQARLADLIIAPEDTHSI
jgi:peptide chain release factor 1